MTWRSLTAALTAGVGFLAFAATAHAQDTVRLKLTPANNAAPTLNLRGGADDAEIADIAYRGGYRGGSRGGYGYHGGYGYRGYASYRGYYGGYRGYYGGYRGYYGGYYYPRAYYYAPNVYYYSTPYYYDPYYPISDTTLSTPAVTLRIGPNVTTTERIPAPLPQEPGTPRTYPYDGGPAVPVPMPKPIPETSNDLKAPPVPVPDRSVSLPASGSSKFAYPAYGEKPRQTDFAADRVEKKSDPIVKKTAPR